MITSLSGYERAPVSKIEKLEGGFSKALLMTTEDGCEYIAKIPCPNAGRPMYCTESEVAVLNFSKKNSPGIGHNISANGFYCLSTNLYDDSRS